MLCLSRPLLFLTSASLLFPPFFPTTTLEKKKTHTVQRPREHAEDAEAFGVIAQRGLESSRLLAAGGKFRTPRALAARLKAAFGVAVPSAAAAAGPSTGNAAAASAATTNAAAIDWDPLARLAASLFRFAPGLSCALEPGDEAFIPAGAVC